MAHLIEVNDATGSADDVERQTRQKQTTSVVQYEEKPNTIHNKNCCKHAHREAHRQTVIQDKPMFVIRRH